MQIYIHQHGQQAGPFSVEDIRGMLAACSIAPTDYGWHDGLTDWQPLNTFLPMPAQSSAPIPSLAKAPAKEVQTNVKQGAVIGGWVCFALGIGLMRATLLSFFIYGPLFFVAFILGIVAMAQRRVFGGLVLLLATLIGPLIFGVNLASTRTVKLANELKKEIESKEAGVVSKDKTSIQPAARQLDAPAESKYPALDEKNGFRTFRLGAPFSEFADLRPAETLLRSTENSGKKSYWAESSDKKIGAAELSGILLVFNQDILERIYVKPASGELNALGLKEALIAAYGQPAREREIMSEKWVWEGNKTKLEFESGMSVNAIFSNKDVTAQIKELIRQKAKTGAAGGAINL